MTLRTRILAVEADETNLSDFAALVQARIDEACAHLEAEGADVLAPVSVTSVRASWSEPVEGSHRDQHFVDNGVIAVITYRKDE